MSSPSFSNIPNRLGVLEEIGDWLNWVGISRLVLSEKLCISLQSEERYQEWLLRKCRRDVKRFLSSTSSSPQETPSHPLYRPFTTVVQATPFKALDENATVSQQIKPLDS